MSDMILTQMQMIEYGAKRHGMSLDEYMAYNRNCDATNELLNDSGVPNDGEDFYGIGDD